MNDIEIGDNVIKKFRTNNVVYGAMYILPDGQMLDLSMLVNGHAEFVAMLGSTAEVLKLKGWLKLNTKLKYIDLPSNPTSMQLAELNRIYAVFGRDFQLN